LVTDSLTGKFLRTLAKKPLAKIRAELISTIKLNYGVNKRMAEIGADFII
jgi:hypothetical protein